MEWLRVDDAMRKLFLRTDKKVSIFSSDFWFFQIKVFFQIKYFWYLILDCSLSKCCEVIFWWSDGLVLIQSSQVSNFGIFEHSNSHLIITVQKRSKRWRFLDTSSVSMCPVSRAWEGIIFHWTRKKLQFLGASENFWKLRSEWDEKILKQHLTTLEKLLNYILGHILAISYLCEL